MDPNETLKLINTFLVDRKSGEEVDEWCAALMGWLERGGFAPDWSKYPLGASYYRCRAMSL